MFPITAIMTRDVVTVSKETPIRQAIHILLEKRITGLPVVDADKNLAGIISEFDILRLLQDGGDGEGQTVADFMTSKVISFEHTATAIEVCEFFINNPSKRRVPIVKDGKLVGLVSRRDVVKLIAMLRHIEGSWGSCDARE